MKITNLVIKTTPFNEDKKWVDALSLKIRLLQNSDWVLLPDSLMANIDEWIIWRQKVKSINRKTFSTPEQAKVALNKLMDAMPPVIKLNFSSVEQFKLFLIEKMRLYYFNKNHYDCISNGYDILLVNEKYDEAVAFKPKSNLKDFPLIQHEIMTTGVSSKDVISSFKKDKLLMKSIIINNYKSMNENITVIRSVNDLETLQSIYDKLRLWTLTLTLNQTIT